MNDNAIEAGTPPPIGELEQVMQTCGYKLRETVDIGGRSIQVYEKPINPKYVITKKDSPTDLEDCIFDLAEELNKSLVLIDDFDKDHLERHKWAEGLNSADKATYLGIKKQNRLRHSRASSMCDMLYFIKTILENGVALPREFYTLESNLKSFVNPLRYGEFSQSEKVLYMEEVDKIVMKILDWIVAQNEQVKFLFKKDGNP